MPDSSLNIVSQIIVGVLLFTPLLLLLPTTLVFYAWLSAGYLAVRLAHVVLGFLAALQRVNPVYMLVTRLFRPGLTPGMGPLT